MAKAKRVSPEMLIKLTRAAVKAVMVDVPGRFVGAGIPSGYAPKEDLGTSENMRLATQIVETLATKAKDAGVSGIRPTAVVVHRRGKIVLGYFPEE